MIRFVHNLASITDIEQRGFALAERLQSFEDEIVVVILKAICDGASTGEDELRRLYNSIIGTKALERQFGVRISRLIQLAQDFEHYEVVAVLLDLTSKRVDYPHQPFLDGALKETPLGMRKSLARRPDFKLIQRIARDQDPRVIKILLNNTRLTETDVIRIAATRPNSPAVLTEIFSNKKWIARHRVKKALIMNPYTPPAQAVRLLAFMSLEDLEEILSRPDLEPIVYGEAERLYSRKEIPIIQDQSGLEIEK